MKVVHIDELQLEVRGPRGRDGTGRRSVIMTGDANRPDNFSFRIMHIEGDSHYSPRHHHNFAQYYYILDGEYVFGKEKLKAGWLGYVPEGVYYGPLTGKSPSIIALQHGGPSGWGIMGYDQHTQGFEELKKTGTFEGGIYRPHPGVQAPKAQDSYEAIWEHVRQRRIVYPKGQYSSAINVNTSLFPWSPLEGAAGVEARHYGTFTSAQYGACAYKLQPRARFLARGRGMYIVLSGHGRLGDGPYRKHTTAYVDEGEESTFTAAEESEVMFLGLPLVSRMGNPWVQSPDEQNNESSNDVDDAA